MTNNIDDLIKKVFGYNFYFTHITTSLKDILKSGKIKLSSDVPNKHYGTDKKSYIYGNIIFDINKTTLSAFSYHDILLINPLILNDMTIMVNKNWPSEPDVNESIFLKKSDTKQKRKDNIKKIYELVNENKDGYYHQTHEVLFTKPIDMKYVIGIIMLPIYENAPEKYVTDRKQILKLLQKDKYHHIKVYYNEKQTFPTLLDVLN